MAGFRTEDPTTGEIVRTWDAMSEEQVEDALAAAQDAFTTWRSTDPVRRAEVLRRTADLLAQHADELADIAAEEMGKPLAQGVGEAQLCSQIFRYYADNAQQLLADDALPAHGANSTRVEKEPLGVLLGVMPWNFPIWQVFRFLAPTLMVGNTALLKHATNVPRCADVIAEVLMAAGVPDGVFGVLHIDNEQAAQVIKDPRVAAVYTSKSAPQSVVFVANLEPGLAKADQEKASSEVTRRAKAVVGDAGTGLLRGVVGAEVAHVLRGHALCPGRAHRRKAEGGGKDQRSHGLSFAG